MRIVVIFCYTGKGIYFSFTLFSIICFYSQNMTFLFSFDLLARLPTCSCISCVHVFQVLPTCSCVSCTVFPMGSRGEPTDIDLKYHSPNILFYLLRYFHLPAAIKKWFLVKKFEFNEPTTFFYSLTPSHKSHWLFRQGSSVALNRPAQGWKTAQNHIKLCCSQVRSCDLPIRSQRA